MAACLISIHDGLLVAGAFEMLELLAHYLVLISQLMHLSIPLDHVFKLGVLFFQNEKLLVHIVGASFSLQVQDFLQVLDLFL